MNLKKCLKLSLVLILCLLILTGCGKKKNSKDNTYNISFNTDGGTYVAPQTLNKGDKVTRPEDPKKDGFIFLVWLLEGVPYNFDAEVTSSLELTAYYQSDDMYKKFTVTFDTSGGSTIEPKSVIINDRVERPEDPTRDGHIFMGWMNNEVAYDFDTPVAQDLTLTAIWDEVPEGVIFVKNTNNSNGEGSSGESGNGNGVGGTINDPSNPNGGGSGNNGNGGTSGGSEGGSEGSSSNSGGSAGPGGSYGNGFVVTFDTDGGNKIAMQIVSTGKRAVKPATPSKTGYTFVEWQLDGKAYDFNTTVTKNMTLKASWNKKPVKEYTVTFDTAGGSTIAAQKVKEQEKVIKPSNPTKPGYRFVEWQYNGQTYSFHTLVTSDMKLTAKWSTDKMSYIVTFNSNGGSAVETQTIFEGDKAVEPTPPTRSGFGFLEWQLNNEPYDFSKKLNGNITLTGTWIKNPVLSSISKGMDKTNSLYDAYLDFTSYIDYKVSSWELQVSEDGGASYNFYKNSEKDAIASISIPQNKNLLFRARIAIQNSKNKTIYSGWSNVIALSSANFKKPNLVFFDTPSKDKANRYYTFGIDSSSYDNIIDGWELYVSKDGSNYTLYNRNDPEGITSAVPIPIGKTYRFKARVYKGGTFSDWSDVQTITAQ